MDNDAILGWSPLSVPWQTVDPFLFCMYHNDVYPPGNDRLGPAASLEGRNIGEDFEGIDGWRMYHGDVVPGFPQHPHRGFETITILRQGYIDHSDSLGAAARFGPGDVQWITVGKGIVHSEMFPLLRADAVNPLELFQIWLNLPKADKFVEPHFQITWEPAVPRHSVRDDNGRRTEITIVAGQIADIQPAAPPPNSWASRPDTDVAIWTIVMEPEARLTLPPAKGGSNRLIYFFSGNTMSMLGQRVSYNSVTQVRPDVEIMLENGMVTSNLLLLQGRPIGEPIARWGPFVMNSRADLERTFDDYRRTGFGGWPWPNNDPVRPRAEGRYAKHPDGRIERVKEVSKCG